MYTIGYDVGTRFIKICLVKNAKIEYFEVTEPGRDIRKAVDLAYNSILKKSGIHSFNISASAATGIGSNFVSRSKLKIDIPHCFARGVYQTDSSVKTVIDVGGFFINIAKIGNNGELIESIENEKCASGSGKFLETIVRAVELPFSELTSEISKSVNPYHLTNNCSVFAESEVVSRVNQGGNRAEILCGLLHSLVSKIETMLGILGGDRPLALIGGVANVEAFRNILQDRLKYGLVSLPIHNQIASAYGAALLAAEK